MFGFTLPVQCNILNVVIGVIKELKKDTNVFWN